MLSLYSTRAQGAASLRQVPRCFPALFTSAFTPTCSRQITSKPDDASHKSEIDYCLKWLDSLNPARIARHDFDISYARSSGAGGQHVNKVSTKATVKMSPELWIKLDWIPRPVKDQLVLGKFPYITKSGAIVIQSERTRSRQDNLEDCFTKFCDAIRNTVYFEKEPSIADERKWSSIREKSNERRLDEKKVKQTKKAARRVSRDEF